VTSLLDSFFDRGLEVFGRAAHAAGDGPAHNHCVAGAPVRVHYVTSALAASLSPAMSSQMALPSGEPPALSIYAWGGEMPGGLLLPPPWETLNFFERGNVRGYQTRRYSLIYDRRPDVFSAFDAQRQIGLYWARDSAGLSYAERAAPMRRLYQAWLQARGLLVLHAAGVSTPLGGALLAGRTGSGKSTTAAACACAGLGYAGDDYLLVEPGAAPRAYGLYRSLKLNREMLDWLPSLAPLVRNRDRLATEKALIYWPPSLESGDGDGGFPLSAILLPTHTAPAASQARAVTPDAAYRALLPDTLFSLLGDARQVSRDLRHLVNMLPCFELALGPDLRQLVAVISEVLASTTGGA